VRKEIERRELLSGVEDVSPASTDEQLREQIHTAKQLGCDSIEATLAICKRFCRDPLLEQVGYFMHHDIKVYIAGGVDAVKARDHVSVQERVFGKNIA
jgi:hypothetical protein